MYEVVWTHQFSNILGGTTESMTLVFAVFLAWLSLGGYICGNSHRMAASPLFFYALLECGIGLAGAGSAFILLRYDLVLVDTLPHPTQPGLRLLVSLIVVTAVIGPATFLMGGTLPLMAEAAKRWLLPSRQITRLYGLNTAGAALGALLPGLVSVPRIGLSGTALAAMGVNLALSVLVLVLRWRDGWSETHSGSGVGRSEAQSEPDLEPAAARTVRRLSTAEFGALAFASGFTILLMELCWGRLARLVIGNRTLAVSVLLCNVLLWLGAASLAHRRVLGVAQRVLRFTERLYLILLLATASLLQLAFGAMAIHLAENFDLPYWVRVGAFLIAMGPPFFVGGLLFPWLLARFPTVDTRTGASVGFLYATNVVGSTLGALLTTFALVEWFGTAMAMLFGSGLFLVLVLVMIIVRERTPARIRIALILCAIWGGTVALLYPRHLVPVPPGEQLVAYRDDRYGVQVLVRRRDGVLVALNNNVRLVAPFGQANTTYAQHLQADLPMLLATETSSIFNIGTGFGITAGAFTLWKNRYKELVSVEILPFMAENQPMFRAENYSFYQEAATRFVRDDGRHLLLSSGRAFDILSVNPIDPRLPGSSSLCTIDFWTRARKQLRPNGVYAQLVWGPQTKMLVQAFSQVFPRFLMFRAYTASYVLIGYNANEDIPPFHLERLTPSVRAAYGRMGIQDVNAFFGVMRDVAEDDTSRWREVIRRSPEAVLHSDDLPILEYSLKHAPAFRVPDEEW